METRHTPLLSTGVLRQDALGRGGGVDREPVELSSLGVSMEFILSYDLVSYSTRRTRASS